MVITILEAEVAAGNVGILERAYREGTLDLPPEIVETFLVREAGQGAAFRIITVWRSQEALDQMRASGVTPKGVQIFEAAGAAATLSVFDVRAHSGH